jgi:hypothetical protein
MRHILFAAMIVGAVLGGCGDTEGSTTPRVVVSPTSLVFNTVPLGGTDVLDVQIENRGGATLRVSNVRLEVDNSFVRLFDPTRTSFQVEPGDSTFLAIEYVPQSPEQTAGDLVFQTNDPQSPSIRIPIATPRPAPQPLVIPVELDFGTVPVGADEPLGVEVRNVGLAPLIVCSAQVTGSPEIRSDLEDVLEAATAPGATFAVLDLFDFPSGAGVESLAFELRYQPQAPGDDTATFQLRYDATGDGGPGVCEGERVVTTNYDIVARAGTSVLEVTPCPVDFGERAVGVNHVEPITLSNLGEIPLQLSDIRLDPERTSTEFTLTNLPEIPGTLDSGATTSFGVRYLPTDFVTSAGVVQIEFTDDVGEVVSRRCALAGVGVDNECPLPVPEGWLVEDSQNRRGVDIDWALPLQTLVLDGTASFDPAGEAIAEYTWEIVDAPAEALHGLRPFAGDPTNPALAEYFLALAGQYRFCLNVVDESGLECDAACVDVTVTPDEAIAVELTWRNYEDPDETDLEGSDVDLHFLKMPAVWGDAALDTYFENKEPFWDPENPSLDIDDTDGAGPETIQLDDPASCQWYAIGAHYYRQSFGTAWATVRIYVNGALVAEQQNKPLDSTDVFWDVARIHWPSGTVQMVNQLLPDFQLRSDAPPVTDAMRTSGLCGLPE